MSVLWKKNPVLASRIIPLIFIKAHNNMASGQSFFSVKGLGTEHEFVCFLLQTKAPQTQDSSATEILATLLDLSIISR